MDGEKSVEMIEVDSVDSLCREQKRTEALFHDRT